MKEKLLASAAALALTLVSATSLAQDWTPKSQGFRIGGAFDAWPTRDFAVLAWDFEGQFAVARVVMIDVDVPFAYATHVGRNGVSQFVVGNPSVGAHWADKVSANVAIHAGGAVAFPTMLAGSSDGNVLGAGSLAEVMRAYADYSRFAPFSLSLMARGGVEWRILPVLFLRGDVELGVHPPVNNRLNTTFTTLTPSAEIEYRLRMGFGFGGKLQAVIFPGDALALDDHAQAAFEPFIGYEAPKQKGFFFRLGLITALDEQLGFGANRGKVATVHLNMGGKF